MLTLRCTAKLRKRLRQTQLADDAQSNTKLGDWYCNLIRVGKMQLILCVSERTRFPVIVTAKDASKFPERLQHALQNQLARLGIPAPLIDQEIAEIEEAVFAKTVNRSVLGTMNDFTHAASFYDFENTPEGLMNLSLHLAETPIRMPDWQTPMEATFEIMTGED